MTNPESTVVGRVAKSTAPGGSLCFEQTESDLLPLFVHVGRGACHIWTRTIAFTSLSSSIAFVKCAVPYRIFSFTVSLLCRSSQMVWKRDGQNNLGSSHKSSSTHRFVVFHSFTFPATALPDSAIRCCFSTVSVVDDFEPAAAL